MVRGRRGGGEGWKWVGEGRMEHEWVEGGSHTAKGGVGEIPARPNPCVGKERG